MGYARSAALSLLTVLALVFGVSVGVRAQQISAAMQTAINNNDSATLAEAMKSASPDVAAAIAAALATSGNATLVTAVFTSLAQGGVPVLALQAMVNAAVAANSAVAVAIASGITAGGGSLSVVPASGSSSPTIVLVTLPNPTQTAQNNTCANTGSCG